MQFSLPKFVGLALCASTSLLLYGCGQHGAPASATYAPPAASVQLDEVRLGPVTESSRFSATLNSRRSVSVHPRVSGLVKEIYVRSGDIVAPGGKLMLIDQEKQQASVDSFEAQVSSGQADVQSARETLNSLLADKQSRQSELKLAHLEYLRAKDLLSQGAVSSQEVDNRTNQLRVAESQVESTEAKIRAQRSLLAKHEMEVRHHRASVKEQGVELRYHTIKAPFSGMVADVPVKLGDYVTPDTVLTSVTQNRPLEVYVSIPTEYSNRIRNGMTVELTNAADAPLGVAKVFFVSPNVENQSQTVLVKAIYENRDDKLRAGQMITARVLWKTEPGVLVATPAVMHLTGQDFVFVAEQQGKNFVAKQKLVKLGDIENNAYRVISGLQPGQKIVVSGIQNLTDGMAIQPKE
ncbi:MAG: efflux transporter periplasmic adaptor subunit [Cyanobacteria bacterium DS2.3.42]|nr:efflux transporter periplasmic adaptor subunit [Cyanobacteria bacterium DS2.3.42]